MLTLTSPVDTPLHRLPAGAKLAALAGFTLALFALPSPAGLGAALAALAVLHLTCGTGFARHAARMLWPLWPFVAVVTLWHLWTGDLRGGAVIVLRMTAAVAAANLVTMTTRLSDMVALVERLARPLAPLLPPRRLALAIALVIRFVPRMADRLARIAEAFRARSPRRPGWRVVVPATLAALDDADRVAEALRARGGTD
jgi:biotin transport system permease protein